MYDQYGFYSDNIPQGGGPAPHGDEEDDSRVNFDFGGFDFGGGGGSGAGSGGGSFRDFFSQFFRGGQGGRGGGMEPEQEPGGDLEYQVEIDFWDSVRGAVKKLSDYADGYLRDVPWNGRGGFAADLSGVRRDWHDSASCGENEIQCALYAMRRDRQIAHRCARLATAKGGCGARKQWMCGFRRAWRAGRGCG